MSSYMKQHIINVVIWIIVAALFIPLFFAKDTITTWGDNQDKTIMVAVLLLIGFAGDFINWSFFKKSRKKKSIITDERDRSILQKATSGGFIISVLYTYLLAISIYMKFEDIGSVPVAWVWFIAYTLIVVSKLSVSSLVVINYIKSGK